MSDRPLTEFVKRHFRHFNAAALVDAADGYRRHIESGGQVLAAIAGAMSTAELGLSLAEMIRQDKIHAISCTGANLEEDLFNLVAHNHYERIPNYRDLTPHDEEELLRRHLNRVTDTCIPEEEAMRRIEALVAADLAGGRRTRRTVLPARVSLPGATQWQPVLVLPNRSATQLGAGSQREEPSIVCTRLGRLHPGKLLRGGVYSGNHQARHHGAQRHRIHDQPGRLVSTDCCDRAGLVSSRSVAGSLVTFRSVWCRCSNRICASAMCRAGHTSARSAIQQRAMALTRARCRTRKSPGAN